MNTQQRSNIPNWHVRLTAELRRDKKKTTILVTLVVVAGFLAGKLLVKQVASASAADASAGSAILVSDSGHSESLSKDTVRTASRGSNGGLSSHRPFVRDIFRPQWNSFTQVKPSGTFAVGRPESIRPTAVDSKKHRIESLAQDMELQGVVNAARPMAIINGQIVKLGRMYKGFKLEAVAAHTCTMSKDGVRVVLQRQGWRTKIDDDVEKSSHLRLPLQHGKEQESD